MIEHMLHRARSRHHHHHGDENVRGGSSWGPGGAFWGGGGPGFGRRRRRGDVKFLLLEMLADGPKHGYEIIRTLEEERGVRPSAGSVYPTLQLLEEGGYVTSDTVDGKRVYTITDAGRELLAMRGAGTREADDDLDMEPRRKLKEAIFKLGAAVMSARGADDATVDKIRAVLNEARKHVYAILASDEA
jgi:DNA-binding PadR family transcriptional regulator